MSLTRFQGLLDKAKMDQKSYQMQGIQWCIERERRRQKKKEGGCCLGGIIADEMGLGKTITVIGLLVSHYMPKTLIVVPVALLEQWAAQILRVTGHIAIVYHGAGVNEFSVDTLEKAPIVLTTYGIVSHHYSTQETKTKTKTKTNSNSKPKSQPPLFAIHWNRIVFDEAHHMRNRRTQKHISADALKSNIRWLITGTPIQNHERDFLSLCSLLGTSPEETIRNHILRRTKKEVGIHIPECLDENIDVPWGNNGEKQLAEEIHSLLSFSNVPISRGGHFVDVLMQPVDSSSVRDPIKFERSRTLRALLLAKQCCVYPALLAGHIDRLLKRHLIQESHPYVNAVKRHKSKLDVVIETVLSRRDNGCGKIIFCQFHGEMDEIKRRLEQADMCVGTLDGRTSKKEKTDILDQYADDYKYNVLILQIQTCCEGLNLQEKYSEVYFASPHWNPALEDQAVARCHRIGQNKIVQVFRFVMNGFDDITEDEDFYITPTSKNKNKNKNKNKKEKQSETETQDVEQKRPISFDRHVTIVQENKRKIINDLMQPEEP